MSECRTYTFKEVQKLTGLAPYTLGRYEKLGLIPFKKFANKKAKIYFQEGIDRAMIIQFLIEYIRLNTTAIKIIFEICTIFNVDLSNIRIICDRLVSKEVQRENSIKKLKQNRNYKGWKIIHQFQ